MINAANIAATARGREEGAMEAFRSTGRDDRFAKIVALLVFALGVGLLLAVFIWTKDWFDSLAQANQEWLKREFKPGTEPTLAEYLPAFGAQVLRAALLCVLAYVSSSIAAKGAHLYSVAAPSHDGSGRNPS